MYCESSYENDVKLQICTTNIYVCQRTQRIVKVMNTDQIKTKLILSDRALFCEPLLLFVQRTRLDDHFLQFKGWVAVQVSFLQQAEAAILKNYPARTKKNNIIYRRQKEAPAIAFHDITVILRRISQAGATEERQVGYQIFADSIHARRQRTYSYDMCVQVLGI